MATYDDDDTCPDDRGDEVPCENCGDPWGVHAGWACDGGKDERRRKSELEPHERYLTKDMNEYSDGEDEESQAFLLMAVGAIARAGDESVH